MIYSFLFLFFHFWFIRTDSHRYAPITVLPYTVNTYRSFGSRKNLPARTKPVPGANSFDQSTNQSTSSTFESTERRTKTNSPDHTFIHPRLELPFFITGSEVDDVLFHDYPNDLCVYIYILLYIYIYTHRRRSLWKIVPSQSPTKYIIHQIYIRSETDTTTGSRKIE